MKALIKLIMVSIGLSICLSAFAANTISKVTYKWTDDQGIIQYTERPPKNNAYEQITVNASGGQEIKIVNAEESVNKSAETTETALDEVVRANERNCKIAKQNMEVLANLARVRVSDDKGENRFLSPEEKQVQVNETQKQIDIYCKDIRTN